MKKYTLPFVILLLALQVGCKDENQSLPEQGHNGPTIDVQKDMIPVAPAAHYNCGGIKVDEWGNTSINNLYAVGECSSTGLHGANRLASNSLLEGLVFSQRAAMHLHVTLHTSKKMLSFSEEEAVLVFENDKILKNELRDLMWCYAGIVRKEEGLQKALKRVKEMLELSVGKLLRLRLLVSKEIIESALKRKASLGAHFIQKD